MRTLFAVLSVVLVVGLSSIFAQVNNLDAQARTLVNAMAARQFDKAEAQFDSTMASVFPADKLSATWDTVIAQSGDFKSILDSRPDEIQGYHVIYVTCQFAKNNLDIRVVFDANGQVGGLQVVPAKSLGPAAKSGEASAKPANLAGDWIGTLDLGALKLRIVFHITSATDGLKATVDSPDQNALGLPVSSVQVNGSSVTVELEKPKAIYEGQISSDLSTLDGSWKQGLGSQPLVMKRVKDKAELAPRPRPQNPQKPYPYREEDVAYDNKQQGDRLAATLTIPPGKGPFPAVVLITGSGPQDRDESLMGHKPFLVLSDYLTRRGIAVLRADDRGTGKSTGDFTGATTADFATDTEAGIAYLKTRPEVSPKLIGLIGHSDGGIIAPMIAARSHDVAFIVMMAGSGVPGDEILVSQVEAIAEAAGRSHDQAMKEGEKERKVLDIAKENLDDQHTEEQLKQELGGEMSAAQIGDLIKTLNLRWFRFFITYDPAAALRKVTCPVLALDGEKDTQVPASQNLPAIRKALEQAGNKNFETVEFPGLNHLFQTARTGAPSEYAEIDETMSPVVLKKIADWISKVAGSPAQTTAGNRVGSN
jgi:uncharacterized protein